jgi:hypothetical protein
VVEGGGMAAIDPDVICIAPWRFKITEMKWNMIVEEWKRSGECVRQGKVRTMFPEDFKKYELVIEGWPPEGGIVIEKNLKAKNGEKV